MTDLVTTDKKRDLITFTPDQVNLIKKVVAKTATDDELKLFLYQCQKTGLDPLARQIYFQKRKNRKTGEETMSILTGIDGYRLIADRTRLAAGQDDPVFDSEEKPMRATVTVYKLVGGIRCPYTATARWDQYYPGDSQGFMWNKMPHLMLSKCAEALALRKAFPAELSGVYVKEEMDQATRENDVIDTTAQEVATSPVRDASPTDDPEPRLSPRRAKIYDHTDIEMHKVIEEALGKTDTPKHMWAEIGERLHGKPSTELRKIIPQVKADYASGKIN